MIETSRLVLRRWTAEDAPALYSYASDARVSELALWPRHTSPEMSREVIERVFMPNDDLFAMVLKESGEAVGCIGLVPAGEEHHAVGADEREAGYWIGRPYWGLGLTTEALAALVGHWRGTARIGSLLITTDVRNAASGRVAEKCGFAFAGNYEYDGIASAAYRLVLR